MSFVAVPAVPPASTDEPGKSAAVRTIALGSGVPGGGVVGTAPAPATTARAPSRHTTQQPALAIQGWYVLLAPPAAFHRALDLAACIAFRHIPALVALFLAARDGELDLHAPVLEIEA